MNATGPLDEPSLPPNHPAFLIDLLGGRAFVGAVFPEQQLLENPSERMGIGMGVSNFLGELGGRNQIGSPFVWDLEFSQTKPALSIGHKYFLRERISWSNSLTYGVLSGNDNLTTEPFRHNRNLQFRSDVFEFSSVLQYHFYKEQLGHIYDLRGVKGVKSKRIGLYIFAGIGGFSFNPKAQVNNGYVALKPLRTEGQGLPGGPEEYDLYGFCVPMGFGLRKALSKQWSTGLELQYTMTFTDYIDDVSGVYYDKQDIQASTGDLAAYLSDPSLGEIPGQTGTNAQRGDSKDNDAYLFLKVQFHYKVYKYRTSSKKYRTRIRRQKIVF
ncbi:MAG: hypothetical protein IPG74_06905 [Flavobacteriales bacterium]|nr:hypothetical protein [Flavobacteriales bacterium]